MTPLFLHLDESIFPKRTPDTSKDIFDSGDGSYRYDICYRMAIGKAVDENSKITSNRLGDESERLTASISGSNKEAFALARFFYLFAS